MKAEKKYVEIAQELINIVEPNNFNKVINCFTRVRFHVINRDIVNEQKIKDLEMVKGINWNGNELQVVIGSDAYKVKEQINELIKSDSIDFDIKKSQSSASKKQSWGQRFIGAANGIIVPMIPLFITSGFISAITAILSSPSVGLIQGGVETGYVTNMNIISGLLYILSNSGIALLSIFFCYSTVKYFGGNQILGIFLGLLISSRYFLTIFSGGTLGSGGWILYQSGDFKISIEAYNNNLIPAVGAALSYVYLDRFIKRWMPASLDMVFRPVLAISVTFFASFLIIMPLLSIINYGLMQAGNWFYNWPIGLGGFFVGASYQPANMFGLSWIIYHPIEIPWLAGEMPSRTLSILDVTTVSLLGSMAALWFKEPRFKEKNSIVSLSGPLVMGITEPTVFGVLIKKPKAFWLSNLGNGLIGILMYELDVNRWQWGGMGFMGALGFGDDYKRMTLFFIIGFIGIILNFLLVFFFYHEKKSEVKLIKQSVNKISMFVWINLFKKEKTNNEYVSWIEIKNEIKNINRLSKINQLENKKYHQEYIAYSKTLRKFLILQDKFEKQQKELNKKISKTKNLKKLSWLEEKLATITHNYYSNQELNDQVKLLEINLKNHAFKLETLNKWIYKEAKVILEKLLDDYNINDYNQELNYQLWNAINDNLITTNFLEAKNVAIDKTNFYQINNKIILKFLPKIS